MIGSLITSQTRIKLLKKFFINSYTKAHLRGLEAEIGESSNAIRIELNRLESAGFLESERVGNKKLYRANVDHPLFPDIRSIIFKDAGIDRIIEDVATRIGKLLIVYLTGDFANGKVGDTIELIFVGRDIDYQHLAQKVVQAEGLVKRKVDYIILDPEVAKSHTSSMSQCDLVVLWSSNSESFVTSERMEQ